MANQTEVLLLQHPLEQRHPKGTARLLHMSLQRSRLVVGETFAPQELHDLLTLPWQDPVEKTADSAVGNASRPVSAQQAVLLYPAPASDAAQGLCAPVLMGINAANRRPSLRLVVLDGTWRKSRKMLHANQLLQALPRLALHNMPPSNYCVRKAHQPEQRSTLEATCAALLQLEGDSESVLALLDSMQALMKALQQSSNDLY